MLQDAAKSTQTIATKDAVSRKQLNILLRNFSRTFTRLVCVNLTNFVQFCC